MKPAEPQIVRGRCSCGQAYRVRDPGPGAKVLCPACGRVMKLRALEFELKSGPVRTQWQVERGTRQMAILRDHGELNLAPHGSKIGLTGEKIYTNRDSMLLGAQNQWPEGWSLVDRPVEVAGTDWLSGGIPTRRSWGWDLLASLWCAGVPRNIVAVLGLALGWMTLGPTVGWLRPDENPSTCLVMLVFGPLLALWTVLTLRHLGLTVRDTMLGEDDVYWARDGGDLWKDAFAPALSFVFAAALTLGPFLLAAWELSGSVAAHPAYWAAAGLVASLASPLLVLTIVGGRSRKAWRPHVLVANFRRLWPGYGVACALGLAAMGLWAWIIRGGVAGLAGSPPMFPVALASWLLGLYAAVVYARTIGLLARQPGRTFEELLQPPK